MSDFKQALIDMLHNQWQRLKSVAKTRKNRMLNNLSQFDQTRLNSAVAWLTRTKAGLFLLNLGIATVLLLVALLKKLKRLKNSLGSTSSMVSEESFEPLEKSIVQAQPRVLLLVESSISQCFHYRVKQKIEQLSQLGCHVEWLPWSDIEASRQRMHFVDLIIFYRAPGFPKVMESITYAQSLGKLVCYDIDDLIFDRQKLTEKFSQTSEQLSDKDIQEILNGADLYKNAIAACSYAIASTPVLQQELAQLVEQKQCYLLSNGLDDDILRVADLPLPEKNTDEVTIFYGSGTKTHDEDFALIGDALAKLMQQYSQVRLVVAGHLSLPEVLQAHKERVQRLPLMDFSSFLYSLRQADIAIAPLEAGLFADCKSEIKWLEAAIMGVPSVVSDTARYRDVIEHGKNGLLAADSDAWFVGLEKLVLDTNLRQDIAKNAMEAALAYYHPNKMAESFRVLLGDMQLQAVADGKLLPQNHRKKVLMVNVLYPPQAIGGATTVVENLVSELKHNYADDYQVSVLTSEVVDSDAYQIREYAKEGVNVTVIGVPYSADLETRYADAKIRELCMQWLQQNRPDLIHFHSMQRLTASVLKAASQLKIPYAVTVHDAWWLSEHQFLLDDKDELVDERQLNPLIASQSAADPANAVKRSQYLATRLQQAERVFAVSEYQAEVYRRNGFDNVVVNRNGVSLPKTVIQSGRESEKLRVGYLGGQSAHKGFNFLKAIVEQNTFDKLEFVIVNLFKDRDYQEQVEWGGSSVQMIGKYSADTMSEFYTNIDVLIAPSIWPESFGLVSREAALHGVWVIAADAGGLAEDIIDGETGFVFPMCDAEKCTEILKKINDDHEYYRYTIPEVERVEDQIVSVAEQAEELTEQYQLMMAARLA